MQTPTHNPFNIAQFVAKTVLVAVAYALFAVGGLFFALPPGFVSLVYPAAGVGVLAVLLGGYRHTLGIIVAAFAVNLFVQRVVAPSNASVASFVTAAAIATGATLHAAAARYLVSRFLRFDFSANQPSKIILFFLLAGPVSALISCSVGSVSLLLAGEILLEDLLGCALVIWVGDSVGVLMATPFLFAWKAHPVNDRWRRIFYVSLPLVFGFAGSAAGYFYLHYREAVAVENDFRIQADALCENLAGTFDKHFQTVDELTSAARLADPMHSREWKELAAAALQRSPGIRRIAWHPWVDGDQRETFEKKNNILITDATKSGLSPAFQREYYLPTVNVAGDQQFQKPAGVDLASLPTFFETLQLAITSRQPALSERIKWDQSSVQGFGVEVLSPVVEIDSLDDPVGIVSVFIDFESMITPSGSNYRWKGTHLRVVDENASVGAALLHSFPIKSPGSERLQEARFYHRANRDWKIVITADDSTAQPHPSGASWWVLTLGTILSSLFGCMVATGIGREAAIQQRVDTQTQELNLANEQLERQVRQLELADRVLDRERNLLRTIIDMLPSEVYVTDIEGRFLINNTAHLLKIGVHDQNSAIGLNLKDLGWPEADQQVAADLETIQTETGHYEREERSCNLDGIEQWKLNTRLPLRDGNKDVVGMVGVCHDVTSRKLMEQSLIETERKMSLALKSARAGTWSWGVANDRFDGDKYLRSLIGNSDEEISVLQQFIEKIHQNDRARVQQCFDRAIANDGEIDTEFQLETNNEEAAYLAMRGQVERSQQGQSQVISGVCWDITREKRAESKLAREQHLFKTLVFHIPDMIYFKNRQSEFIRVNRAMVKYHAFTDENDIVGKTDFDLYDEKHASRARDDELNIMKSGEAIVGQEEHELKPDGTSRWVLTTKIPLFDDQGEIIGTCGVTRDISALKRQSELLSERKDELETLLRISSHDLQEPLRSMRNFCSKLQQKSAMLDDEANDFIERISVGAERMNRLVSDVAEMSMAQTSVSPIQWVKGGEIVKKALNALEEEIEATQANVVVADDFPEFFVDRTWVIKAVYNLVENALKFVKSGEQPQITIEAYAQNGETGFVVSDRGPGVPSQHALSIFQLFKRTVGREITGTGAGLAVTLQVAKIHFGNAWVEPRDEGGSRFIITLNHIGEFIED